VSTSDLDYFALVRESRRLDVSALTKRVRVAVLSDAATPHLLPILRVLFARTGYAAELYAGEIGAFETDILDRQSALHRFDADAIVLLPAAQALRERHREAPGDRATFGEDAALRFASLWDALAKTSRATVVQATSPVPFERDFGSHALLVPGSLESSVTAFNATLTREARARRSVLLCDLDGVAAWVGKQSFFDEKLWTIAKSYAAFEHLPRVAQAIRDVVLAARGRTVKCVVTDLDDTLWGGVIGDDGLEGIRIGHDGEGEAFRRLQLYLRELSRRGVALAVCSKNDEAVAIRPFREHPDMVLREGDIAVFHASWGPKVDGLERIRAALEIGFDSMVFLDDNAFERNLVRHYLPEVIVPDLPEDPSEVVRALAALNLFETASYTDEDRKRSAAYREEAARKELARSFTSVDDFLASLDMRVTLARFDAMHLPRVVQLLARSNQFNLTTRRESEAACEALMRAGADVLPLYVKLSDKLGDYGLISVVIAHTAGDALEIDTWVMSCRVLARGVEEYAMNHVVAKARELGASRVVGRYVPTAKNKMVADFYGRFGFTRTPPREEEPAGETTWTLEVARYEERLHRLTESNR
jgi:FkbH-like protein